MSACCTVCNGSSDYAPALQYTIGMHYLHRTGAFCPHKMQPRSLLSFPISW